MLSLPGPVKIFLYASSALVVLALPVSVLISSLMSMGAMGEYYELTSIKACGIALPRVLLPMFVATLMIAGVSFILSIYIVPEANLKLYSLLYDVKEMKRAFSLKPGHFNHDITGYVIRVSDRDTDREMLYGIKIYDHTGGQGSSRVILADQTLDAVAYTGVAEALAEPDTHVLLFGKPNARPNRRMGVALAAGADVAEARARADRAAGKITVVAAS